uniref:Uncharacterized protein n=1 Tax=Rhizophora mucronata TaxID=61149 RepID=A0A2P2PML4_RHIMU
MKSVLMSNEKDDNSSEETSTTKNGTQLWLETTAKVLHGSEIYHPNGDTSKEVQSSKKDKPTHPKYKTMKLSYTYQLTEQIFIMQHLTTSQGPMCGKSRL